MRTFFICAEAVLATMAMATAAMTVVKNLFSMCLFLSFVVS
jgi:hypothetical protein